MKDIILYKDKDGSAIIKGIADAKNNTIWTTQKTMAEFFDKDVGTISYHLNNIFKCEELVKEDVTLNTNQTDSERIIVNSNSRKQPILYSLDALISVGFRIHTNQAIRFRRWAIKIIRNYIIKGFALDVESLKYNGPIGENHFPELVEEVRKIGESRLMEF